MRNWNNTPFSIHLPFLYPFLAYLWGIEIKAVFLVSLVNILFLAYLWGIEIWLLSIYLLCANQFLAYLWGIEIMSVEEVIKHAQQVFSLPMRNWNKAFGLYSLFLFPVFSLPMRNWNSSPRDQTR